MTARTRSRRERGAVTIIVVAIVVMVGLMLVAASRLGSTAIGRARAETAADAAALAAADALALGDSPAAARAAAVRLARANGARLISCRCIRGSALVVVEMPLTSKKGPSVVRASSQAKVGVNCPNCRPRS